LDVFEQAQLVATIISSIATAAAAIFSYFAVKTASESFEVSKEQIEKGKRPVLEIFNKDYKVNFTESFLTDWRNCSEEEVIPRYSSAFYLSLGNIGNVTARNVSVSFYYKGIESINFTQTDLFKMKKVQITPKKRYQGDYEYNQYIIDEENINGLKREICDDINYLEYLGSIQPGTDQVNRIYLPKIVIYLTNILSEEIQNEEQEIQLLLKLRYSGPYGEKYFQQFKIINKIRNVTKGSTNEMVGKLVAEELSNKKL